MSRCRYESYSDVPRRSWCHGPGRKHGAEAAALYPNVLGCLVAVLAAEGRDDEALAQYTEASARAATIGDRDVSALVALPRG